VLWQARSTCVCGHWQQTHTCAHMPLLGKLLVNALAHMPLKKARNAFARSRHAGAPPWRPLAEPAISPTCSDTGTHSHAQTQARTHMLLHRCATVEAPSWACRSRACKGQPVTGHAKGTAAASGARKSCGCGGVTSRAAHRRSAVCQLHALA